MKKIIEIIKNNIRTFLKFGCVGAMNAFISYGIYIIFVLINPELYLIGSVTGYIASTFNAYFWNGRMVFKSENKKKISPKYVVKTYISYGVMLVVNTGIIYFLVHICQINEKVAPFISMVICTPTNYLLNKLWVFKKEKETVEEIEE